MTDRALAGEPVATAEKSPPFGSKRAAALALYTPPFRFEHGYIFDAKHKMVADQGGFDEQSVEHHVAARVRGWGRIGYMPDAEALQDEVGVMLAEALTTFWTASPPSSMLQQAVEPIPLTKLDELARLYATSYASPHHFTMSVEGLRNLIAELRKPT